jgi:predicted phage terminase large subunit-like protein
LNGGTLATLVSGYSEAEAEGLLALVPAFSTQRFAETYRHFSLGTPWFHEAWYEAYDNPEFARLYVQGPREHAKTSTVLTYAIRRLAEDHHLRVGIVSGTDGLAMKFLNELKYEFTTNADLLRDYGTCKRCTGVDAHETGSAFAGETWTQHELVLRDARLGPHGISGKDVSVFSVGRGAQISSRHCDLLIVDDVENAESVKSDVVRQSTREWWAREAIPVLSPGGKQIVVGTRKHFDDLYARLINDTSYHVLNAAKSVFFPDGAPIWPEMWSIESLLARKAQLDQQDLLAWPQEYLNEPRPSETQMFYPEKWPTYANVPYGLTILQFWDLAISEKTNADYTCGWTIGVDEANNVLLLERRKGHWDFNRTLSEIQAMGQAWSAPDASGVLAMIGIEQVSYQAAAVQEALRRTMLPIVPVVPDKDKVTRARLLEARAAANKVVRPANAPDWWMDFAAEATYFPAGAHDDQIDALSGAVRLAGWQADSINWQYSVWKCLSCSHMFLWQANRPCPKCSTKAPPAYDNPELLAYGGSGMAAASIPDLQ